MSLLVAGGRLLGSDAPVDVLVGDDGTVAAVTPQGEKRAATGKSGPSEVIDADGMLLAPPYVEPHVHLDTALTAGEPRWNESGTLWEGIARWAERRETLSHDDVVARATQVLRWQVANGVLYVRSHVDVTDPELTALRALVEVRERVRDVLTLQLVAFPQEGIVSSPRGTELLAEAVRLGVDVVGAIPHYEDTREDGVASLSVAVELAAENGLRVDAHCDEIDDEQSRFVEVLATLAKRTGMRERVTASHTTAMGSYNAAYAAKLQRVLGQAGINLVCNPMVNLQLQGRYDDYPKRRGLTQVKEMLVAGVNVAFGQDDVMDPWFPLGTANPAQVALVGALATQMTSPSQTSECYRMVTDRAARVLGVQDEYGIGVRRRASFLVLDADDPFDVLRRQVRPRLVVAGGRVVARGPADGSRLSWPGEPDELVDFRRRPVGAP